MESVTDFHIRMCVDIAVFGDREAINAYSYFLIFETYWRVSVFSWYLGWGFLGLGLPL